MSNSIASKEIRELLQAEGFTDVMTAGKFVKDWPEDLCGIYTWVATNGEAYAGQATNLRTRLQTHKREQGDLIWAAIRPVRKQHLDTEEQRLIKRVEAVACVRNIQFAKSTVSRVPYDVAISENHNHPADLNPQAAKKAKAFERFLEDEQAAQHIANARWFIEHAIPDFWKTEGIHWSVTTFPEGGLRVNCGVQEVMTSMQGLTDRVRIHIICPTRLKWNAWVRLYQTRSLLNGFSQRQFDQFTNWTPVQEFAIHLMRHTTALNARSHCPQVLRYDLTG